MKSGCPTRAEEATFRHVFSDDGDQLHVGRGHVPYTRDAVGDKEGKGRRKRLGIQGMDVHVPQSGDEILAATLNDARSVRQSDLTGLADRGNPLAGGHQRHARLRWFAGTVDERDIRNDQMLIGLIRARRGVRCQK